ncbi:SMI1/KNR4 family protein [Priestia endophytica]|uniref:SMI1-KNR4 cell-wall n=1 Tax=Priestia endophytica DSM 13796 TaxID=1121089 RepID=A0A1I6BDQ1_9BACI|nr:SMI1/KNR4 family protein [Priestia endophytica]SFQ78907.1 SMI1-KNR4 cell-wall [Priestia endophytica DSM 13796]
MNNKILQMISGYEEDKDFFGEASEEALIEEEIGLEVNFPPQYREYVKKYGSGGICGVDILGVEGEADGSSVIEQTERRRKQSLPKKYIVIENVDEFVYCLSTVEEYKVIRWSGITKEEIERYTTFNEYLQDSFQEVINNWEKMINYKKLIKLFTNNEKRDLES